MGRDRHTEQSRVVLGQPMTALVYRWIHLDDAWGNPVSSCASGIVPVWHIDVGLARRPLGAGPHALRPSQGLTGVRLVTLTECDHR